jgi:hypothetical protein
MSERDQASRIRLKRPKKVPPESRPSVEKARQAETEALARLRERTAIEDGMLRPLRRTTRGYLIDDLGQ